MMNIKGSYTFNIPLQGMFLNELLQVHKSNIITLLGESFFLHRAIDDEYGQIQYICLGNSSNTPQKTDLQLGNETIRKKCAKTVDLDKRQIVLSASFSAKEIIGTTEIGVANDEILITHDAYNKNDIDDLLTPTIGDITIDYYIEISTGAVHNRNVWAPAPNKSNVYYIRELNNVVGIFEDNTGNGYVRVDESKLENTRGAFYYDINTRNLYVHTVDNTNPCDEELIILTR